VAAAAIIGGAVLFSGADRGQAEALELGERNIPAHAAASPIRRCMNMGGALEADYEGEWGYKIRKEDFTRLKLAGFDTVRIPIKFSAHTDRRAPYKISPAMFKRVDQILDWAIVEGLQVIIDVHHYEELMKNPHIHEPRLEAMWKQIAYRYATAPDSVIFEVINEPNDKLTIARTDGLNRRILSIIRQHNKNRWVILPSSGWGHLESLVKSNPPRDPRVMTTFHFYDPFEFTHQGASWIPENYPVGTRWSGTSGERMAIRREMDLAAAFKRKTGMPIFLGEFGAIGKADARSRAVWTESVRTEAERHGIGWCFWDWATGFPAYDTERETWVPGMKRALTGR